MRSRAIEYDAFSAMNINKHYIGFDGSAVKAKEGQSHRKPSLLKGASAPKNSPHNEGGGSAPWNDIM
jgi:hypothetical protein